MTNKERIKAGLNFGVCMTLFYILQDLFTKDNHTTLAVIKAIASGLIGGAMAGILFGWLIGPFSRFGFFTPKTDLLLNEGESITFESPANHYKGIEAVGGKLVLTNKRLIFKSHRINIQNHQWSIDLSRLIKADRFKNLGLVNNGISVTTDSGITEKFVVSNADEWMKEISNCIFIID